MEVIGKILLLKTYYIKRIIKTKYYYRRNIINENHEILLPGIKIIKKKPNRKTIIIKIKITKKYRIK